MHFLTTIESSSRSFYTIPFRSSFRSHSDFNHFLMILVKIHEIVHKLWSFQLMDYPQKLSTSRTKIVLNSSDPLFIILFRIIETFRVVLLHVAFISSNLTLTSRGKNERFPKSEAEKHEFSLFVKLNVCRLCIVCSLCQ